jgi:oligopeptide/dipeptide ABC transporter ATP-binding protein
VTAVLSVSELVKHFAVRGSRQPVQAVNGVSFELARGETLGLVGESGSGKTTVGRCVLGLEPATSGSIRLLGGEIAGLKQRLLRPLRRHMQIVFQQPYDALSPRMTISDSIREPLRALGVMTTRQQRARVAELADQMGLDREHLRRYPHELSAGRLQRVGIARAMATEPDLIVLDEPTSLLDTSVRADVVELLAELQRTTGVAFIFISHDLTAVQHVSHAVAVMYLGKIVERGSVDQIFAAPLHPYTRALLSAVLLPEPGRRRDVSPLEGEIPSPVDLPTGCSLHGRCPLATAICRDKTPALVDVGGGHRVACHEVVSGRLSPGPAALARPTTPQKEGG